MDIIVLKELLWEFSLELQESERRMLCCPSPTISKSILKTGPVFLIIFLVPFKTNGKMWALKI